jgi:hypothetical protein
MQDSHAMPNAKNEECLAIGLGIELSTNSTSGLTGDVITFKLSSQARVISAFKGVLLYAEAENGQYGGGWVYSDDFQNPSMCDLGPGLGHTNSEEKDFPAFFSWRVPSSTSLKSENFTFRGIVVVDKNRWGLLNSIVIPVNQVNHTFQSRQALSCL